jgi:hypothetical protein
MLINNVNIRIDTQHDLIDALSDSGMPHYVYVLCEQNQDELIPFYVGIGQGERIFSHEDEARETDASNLKLDKIRSIWLRGESVIRYIDSFHTIDPWSREEELINDWGLVKDGTGLLTNSQRYAPATAQSDNEVELRKYAKYGNSFPDNFKHRFTRLAVGPQKPKSESSVYGKIYAILSKHSGVTGEELAGLLLSVDFSGNKSAYTQNGQISLPWLAGYIDGGFYKKNLCIQKYNGS